MQDAGCTMTMMNDENAMRSPSMSRRHIVVIVLGDVGRSPRMQYHTRSLLEQGHYVTLVGYGGEELIPDLQSNHKKWSVEKNEDKSKIICDVDCIKENLLNIVRFDPYSPPVWLKKYKILRGKLPVGLPLYLLLRLFGLLFGLTYALWYRASKRNKKHFSIDCILVQNPPSIPLLLISYLYCISHTRISTKGEKKINVCRPGLVIDWHNLGYTMFDTSPNHPVKKIAKYYEKKLAPLSDGNLCVTASMRDFLITNFNVKKENISVLHDRPPEFFHPTTLETKHDLMMKLRDEMELFCPELQRMRLEKCSSDDENMTLFTKCITTCDGGKTMIVPQDNQPALLISSTSWTPDEDFSILLDALVKLNSKINENQETDKISFPHLIVVVTGKGPQKDMYKSRIAKLDLNHVSIITMWLEAKDYPLLLGCSDLGISLHVSTSGFDLPMKIYDFYGCEVPVCAISFSCLGELVQDGVNGRVFNSSDQLSGQIYDLFHNIERDQSSKMGGELKFFRENIAGISRWRENWIENAHEIILAACPTEQNNSKEERNSIGNNGDKKKN